METRSNYAFEGRFPPVTTAAFGRFEHAKTSIARQLRGCMWTLSIKKTDRAFRMCLDMILRTWLEISHYSLSISNSDDTECGSYVVERDHDWSSWLLEIRSKWSYESTVAFKSFPKVWKVHTITSSWHDGIENTVLSITRNLAFPLSDLTCVYEFLP